MKRIECRTCGTKLTSYNNSCSLCGGHEYVGIGLNKEEKMSRKNLVDYLIDDAAWKTKARAAGWSPPVQSQLRAVEKCNYCAGIGRTHGDYPVDCSMCKGTGTITRPLTQEEMAEMLETYIETILSYNKDQVITLKSGVKVILEDK